MKGRGGGSSFLRDYLHFRWGYRLLLSRFLDTHNHCLLHTWKSSASIVAGTIRTITVNQSETLIAVGYSTGAIALLETRTGTLIANWKGGETEVSLVSKEWGLLYTEEETHSFYLFALCYSSSSMPTICLSRVLQLIMLFVVGTSIG